VNIIYLYLFQGEITSPIFFSIFLHAMVLHLQGHINIALSIDQISIYLLLFADDTAIISVTRSGLQKSLDTLLSYSNRCNLTVKY
jgi:hypothetical protein